MLDPLLSDLDVEKITHRAQSTLQKDRVAGRGIPFIRIGRLVRYRQSDVIAFIKSLPTYCSTSEADVSDIASKQALREEDERPTKGMAEPPPQPAAQSSARRRSVKPPPLRRDRPRRKNADQGADPPGAVA